jgi:hypothetical protein
MPSFRILIYTAREQVFTFIVYGSARNVLRHWLRTKGRLDITSEENRHYSDLTKMKNDLFRVIDDNVTVVVLNVDCLFSTLGDDLDAIHSEPTQKDS